jgi:hypothetical protein
MEEINPCLFQQISLGGVPGFELGASWIQVRFVTILLSDSDRLCEV